MGIFSKGNKSTQDTFVSELPLSEEISNEKTTTCFYIINEFHKLINGFFIYEEDLDSGKFKNKIDHLAENFTSRENPKRLKRIFNIYKDTVLSFFDTTKRYLQEKDKEFKDIIKLLTGGMSALNTDNREFNYSINEHTSQLEKLNILDDIRTIKTKLQEEVTSIKDAVKEKEKTDNQRLMEMSETVTALKEDLLKAKTASMTDKLTGAFNRLAFDKHIEAKIKNMGIRWSYFSALMIDIDNFKNINDTQGHLVGDRVIAATVQTCKTFLRKNDFIARYGGEEFVIILDGASLKNATKKADTICKKIALTDFIIDKKEPKKFLSFTVSIGIATFREGDTPISLLDRSDKALYVAKNSGKNKVVNEKNLQE